MENKYKNLDVDISIQNSISDMDKCNTHFDNHMSSNYKDVIVKSVIIILSVISVTILLV